MESHGKKPLVLICDDSIIARNSLKNMLSKENCKIVEAYDGLDSLKKITELNPDFVLLDLLMPGMNGIDVLKSLKKSEIKLNIVVVSADVQNSTKQICLENGAIDFINKPPKMHEIVDIFRKLTQNED